MSAPRRAPRVASFVLVVGYRDAEGDPWSIEREGGTAQLLRQLGAEVKTRGIWEVEESTRDVDGASGGENERDTSAVQRQLRAVVLEVGERPDIAVGALRHLRRHVHLDRAPVIVAISERQIARLDPSSGFDDFLVLPCRAEELYARIRALEWRRSEFANEERSKVGGLLVDRVAHEVTVEGRSITLTAKEFALVSFLAAHRGRVFSREALLARVWGRGYSGGPRTVDIHVRRLRAKIGEALPLETMRGAGYKMRAPEAGEAP